MATRKSTSELRLFHRFIENKLRNGGARLSPEKALEEWRDLYPDEEAFEREVAAIQEALDDVTKGDGGITFEEFDREFRKRHQAVFAHESKLSRRQARSSRR